MFKVSGVRIPSPDTRWTFFTSIYCKNWIGRLKKTENKRKETGDGPFFKKKHQTCRTKWIFVLLAPSSESHNLWQIKQ